VAARDGKRFEEFGFKKLAAGKYEKQWPYSYVKIFQDEDDPSHWHVLCEEQRAKYDMVTVWRGPEWRVALEQALFCGGAEAERRRRSGGYL
jgi:hypothetical protein